MEILTMTEYQIAAVCNKYKIKYYTINPDMSIDVDGSVDLSCQNLSTLPLKFRSVTYNFYCHNNELTSIEGCPIYVGGDFYCSNNNLTSLQHCPERVGGQFNCSWNNLSTLNGCPKFIGNDFCCHKNKLSTLEGGPKYIGGDFYCSFNNIKTRQNIVVFNIRCSLMSNDLWKF